MKITHITTINSFPIIRTDVSIQIEFNPDGISIHFADMYIDGNGKTQWTFKYYDEVTNASLIRTERLMKKQGGPLNTTLYPDTQGDITLESTFLRGEDNE